MFVSLFDSYLPLPLDTKLSRTVAISALLTIVSLYLLSRRLSTSVYLILYYNHMRNAEKKYHLKREILIALGLWKYDDWFFSIYKKNYNGKWSYKLKFTNKKKNILYLLNKHNFIEVKSGVDTCNYSILRNQVFIFLSLVCPNSCIIFHIAITIDKMLKCYTFFFCFMLCHMHFHRTLRCLSNF